jgi:hypothetical protein
LFDVHLTIGNRLRLPAHWPAMGPSELTAYLDQTGIAAAMVAPYGSRPD